MPKPTYMGVCMTMVVPTTAKVKTSPGPTACQSPLTEHNVRTEQGPTPTMVHTKKAERVPPSSFTEPSEPSQVRPEDRPKETLRGEQEENPQVVAHQRETTQRREDSSDAQRAGTGATTQRQLRGTLKTPCALLWMRRRGGAWRGGLVLGELSSRSDADAAHWKACRDAMYETRSGSRVIDDAPTNVRMSAAFLGHCAESNPPSGRLRPDIALISKGGG
ncbi:hypothetical protein C8Q78DRAFT_991411 [Trametes maxima]|nr:hypothetical protein C8Q78DRAFT_991411 [Trametes maxima]